MSGVSSLTQSDEMVSPAPPKRILSLDAAGLLWGSERALLDFLGEIPGFEAACCCPSGSPLIAKLKDRGIRCFPYFQKNLHQRGVIPKGLALLGLMRAILKFRPHVLHVNQAGATRIALLACRFFRLPCVVHVRLREDVEHLSRLRPSADVLKCLIAISRPIEDLIGAQPELAAIPCRMLLDAYRPECDNGPLRQATDKSWDFVCVGRFSESKGQEMLVRALHAMPEGERSHRLAFVGEINDCAKQLQCLVKELELESRVDFLGHRDNVGEILKQSRWLLCPSDYEPLGRVLFEAWDYGIPVIVGRRSGGAAGSVCASSGGLLFDEWTTGSLAQCLSRASACDDRACADLADAGRAWLVLATNPQSYAAFMAEVLRDAKKSLRVSS